MRIVSLVPAGTEIACALGAGDELVAVTHDCDFPPFVRELPRVTSSTIPAGTKSAGIDAAVRAAAERGESTFHLDADALMRARPDVLLGQTLCDVCAVTLAQVPRAMDPAPETVPLVGDSIEGILADIARAGTALGRSREASELVASLRDRLADVMARVASETRPTVVCLEWLDPLFAAGHWVPEQVALAGGQEVIGRALERSSEVTMDQLVAADPEFVFLMPCGFDATRAASEATDLHAHPAWTRLAAVRRGNVHVLDGNAYFSRPGPRVVDGVELLASILHPGTLSA